MQKAESHIPVLDGVRGLAISMILIGHWLHGMHLPTTLGRIVLSTLDSFWIGVDLFFVLSGFLITGILYDTRKSENYFRVFYMRRFLRIFPLYYGFLFLLMALTYPLQLTWGGRQFIYLAYLQNIGLAHHLSNQPLSPLIDISHFWSLAVEEQFYFVWPAVVFLLKDRRKIMWAAVILTLCSIGLRLLLLSMHYRYEQIYIFTPTRADSLMVGALLALALRSGAEMQVVVKRAAWVLLPCCVVMLIGMAWPYDGLTWASKEVASVGYTIVALASASLIALSLATPSLKAVFEGGPLRWLGKYSYGIYVFHFPVLALAAHLRLPARLSGPSAGDIPQFILSGTALAISIVLAVISFHFYESKFLGLKKYFRYSYPVSRDAGDIRSKSPEIDVAC
jgi:peptidoglycan/LPS O-acetylase OafA/YrhL